MFERCWLSYTSECGLMSLTGRWQILHTYADLSWGNVLFKGSLMVFYVLYTSASLYTFYKSGFWCLFFLNNRFCMNEFPCSKVYKPLFFVSNYKISVPVCFPACFAYLSSFPLWQFEIHIWLSGWLKNAYTTVTKDWKPTKLRNKVCKLLNFCKLFCVIYFV